MKVHKKALIITYYWPPAGGPGVQRWLKFVKYLPEFGIEPIVYCPENPSYPITDNSLIDEVSSAITILKQPIKEPYRFANFLSKKNSKQISSGVIPKQKKQTFIQKMMLYIRGNFFIPDARKDWVKPSVSFLSDYIVKHNIETIITTGPPHSLHLIGLQLKQKHGFKWLADFRDPWTTIGYHKQLKLTKSSAIKHLELESKVLQTADQIIVTSDNTKKEFESKTRQPIAVITNGFDVNHVERPKKDSKFTMSHIGSLLSERNPKQLWDALSELINENSSFSEAFQLQLIGVVSDDIIQTFQQFGLTNHVKTLGYVSHEDAIKAQMSSRLLLLIEIDSEETKVIIPGKLFEYMVSETPILAVGPKDSDVETILKSTNTGQYYYYDQKRDIKSQVLSYFEAYKTDSLLVNPIGLQKYSRKALTKSLSDLLKD
ncbi:glycosyltransferase family 4 protein [Psychroserpens ponticola]|uniref:Glycosyltransferase family 4 protein n=1 Tax=Psychroserpens ponticola TaxID=2932268 RepID=A0ABY7RUG5_9FLAO|nr:glycosyltransferase family 4 protein [Psychroserpens ponticola]WCO00366.1 glycosyltransferase family 4 protein [Psychroserpens ponticola]